MRIEYSISCQNDLKMREKTTYCNYLCVTVDFIRSSGWSLLCENWCRGGRLRKEVGGNWPLKELWRWLFVCSHLKLR